MRGLSVYLCQKCSLVQSLPRIDQSERREVAVSAGAGWGNIRYGKGFRTKHAMKVLQDSGSLNRVRKCLDVGANRGSFVQALREQIPAVEILAVEPDGSVVDGYRNLSGINLVVSRIESLMLPDQQYDLIYCSHTLEHLRSPHATLSQLRSSLKPDGVLFIEVPNLDFIQNADVVEEFFIDKHLYHFTVASLTAIVRRAGLIPVPEGVYIDSDNITMLLRVSDPNESIPEPREVVKAKELVSSYRANLADNYQRLRAAASNLNQLAKDNRLVVWGAGRIFDSLVRQGGLRPEQLAGLVDKVLCNLVENLHGLPVESPNSIVDMKPDVVVVASRAYFDEIVTELKVLVPDCDVSGLDDLLTI